MPDSRPRSVPAVVFVDEGRWESFSQLAAILQREKIRTVRISVGPPGWRAEHLLFDRNVFLDSSPDPLQLSQILSSEYVADVQPAESMARVTYAALDLLPASQRSNTWNGRPSILDKWYVSGVLRDIGLRTPETLLFETTSPAEAVAQLSLPIVLKRRVGASGSNVSVFETLESLQDYVETLDHPHEWFYEKFIEGESLVCASCVGDDGIDVIATYDVIKRIYVRGPSSVVEFHHDARLEESARQLVGALPMRGLMCFDVIRDNGGVDWIHDVNPRVFGGFAMSQLVGFDFRGAYVRFLSGRGSVSPSHFNASTGKSFSFPEGRRDLLRSEHRFTAWRRTSLWIWRNWQLLGSRYFLFFLIERPMSSLQKNWRRLRPPTQPGQTRRD